MLPALLIAASAEHGSVNDIVMFFISTSKLSDPSREPVPMARKIRVQYPDAIYVMNPGDHGELIFLDESGRLLDKNRGPLNA
jgi:hypothetical protein